MPQDLSHHNRWQNCVNNNVTQSHADAVNMIIALKLIQHSVAYRFSFQFVEYMSLVFFSDRAMVYFECHITVQLTVVRICIIIKYLQRNCHIEQIRVALDHYSLSSVNVHVHVGGGQLVIYRKL